MVESFLIKPPNCFWARRREPNGAKARLEIVQVSDVFGTSPDYWSIAVLGSDQHRSLTEFEFIAAIIEPMEAD